MDAARQPDASPRARSPAAHARALDRGSLTFNQSWNPAPAPGPYLLSHQTDPGDPILEFSKSNISSCARERGQAGAGAGKGTAIALPSSGEGGERLHLRVAGVGRAVGTKEDRNPKGRAQRLGVPGQGPAPSTRRDETRTTTKVTVAREDDGEDRLGSEPDEVEGSRKKS